jgi:glycosyltransferase involved in cell wall biosynthesis
MAPKSLTILFLNENPLPTHFTRGTISGKELRLRSALPYVKTIHVICAKGFAVDAKKSQVGPLEQKVLLHHLPSFPHYLISVPLFIWGLYYALRYKPDTIEAESPIFSGLPAVLIGKLLNVPTIVEIRNTFTSIARYRLTFLPLKTKKRVINVLQLFVFRHASLVIANSKTYHAWLKNHGIYSVVINPGLQYPPPSPQTKFHQPPIVGYLGRLVIDKGIDYFIDAIDILAKRGGVPKFKVEIAGDGPYKTNLINQIQSRDLYHLITLLGLVPNYPTLEKWDILVNPCLINSPLEMVNAEAAYMGLPVICFGNGRYPETVLDQQTGIHVKTKSAQHLANAIRLLLKNKPLHQHLSQHAITFAKDDYSFEKQVQKLDKAYKHLIV